MINRVLSFGALVFFSASLGCTVERVEVPAEWRKPAKKVARKKPAIKRPELTPQERAKKLAQKVIVADGHIDLPYRLFHGLDDKGELTEDVSKRTEKGDFDLVRAKAGGLDAPFMSIYTPASKEDAAGKSKGAKAHADLLIDLVEKVVVQSNGAAKIATSPAEIRANHKAGVISLLLGMENGSPIEGKLENVDAFFARGIRYITLAHAKDNHLADSSYDDGGKNKGLSKFGKDVVARMNALGIFVDVSHLSDAAATQAIEISTAPVIASHSSCRHFTPEWERNISDELIKAVAKTGGVVMINFGSTFLDDQSREASKVTRESMKAEAKVKGLKEDTPEYTAFRKAYYAAHPVKFSTVEKAADHVEHVIKVAGVDHVGFGSDFDGVGDSLPVGLKDVAQYPNLIRVLLERGHSEADIEKIAGGNLLRAWDKLK